MINIGDKYDRFNNDDNWISVVRYYRYSALFLSYTLVTNRTTSICKN